MRISAIVLDLDGTLLQSNKQISERNAKAVSRCYSLGLKVIFATARPPRTVKQLLPDELLQIGSFIYYNGAYIECLHTGLNIHIPIPASLTSDILDACIQENLDIEISVQLRILETDGGELIQISAQEAAKELGVAAICRAYGIRLEEVAAFGDDYNEKLQGQTMRTE